MHFLEGACYLVLTCYVYGPLDLFKVLNLNDQLHDLYSSRVGPLSVSANSQNMGAAEHGQTRQKSRPCHYI